MSKIKIIFLCGVFLLVGLGCGKSALAQTMAEQTAGKILLQTESKGEAWYVHPKELVRYYLGRPADAFSVMRKKGIGIANDYLAKIPESASLEIGDMAFRQKMSGQILLQFEKNGEAWYVYPKNLKRYYLGRPADAFSVMRQLGLGITDANLSDIPVSDVNAQNSTNGISYIKATVKTARGDFSVNMIVADLSDPKVKILTDSANPSDCPDNCPVKPLKDYVVGNNAFAGMNGSYFCPKDYTQCASSDGFYYYQIYNAGRKVLINADRVKYTGEPMIVFNNEQNWVFYSHTTEFKDVATFESTYNTKIQAAISNGPALVYQSRNIVDEGALDNKQRTVKSNRGGLGLKGKKVYLLVASGATVGDLGAVMESLGMEYAINLDGGGSSSLYFNGQYKMGPGRNIPNAIVVTER